ncbi:hypothetical protein PoB_000093600, partial [Plakobranchus ocellatus]
DGSDLGPGQSRHSDLITQQQSMVMMVKMMVMVVVMFVKMLVRDVKSLMWSGGLGEMRNGQGKVIWVVDGGKITMSKSEHAVANTCSILDNTVVVNEILWCGDRVAMSTAAKIMLKFPRRDHQTPVFTSEKARLPPAREVQQRPKNCAGTLFCKYGNSIWR